MYYYTNKDYEAIFEYLKKKATELSDGQWTDFTDGDFGTIVIHLLSYWGDLLSNQLDLTASELFLDTAEERTSLMEIVKLIGYEPSHYQSSITYTDIKYNRVEGEPYTPYVLPAFTQFLNTAGTLNFYNLYETTLSDDITTVTLYEGAKVNKTFYYNDIDEYGRISLGDYYAASNTVVLTAVSGGVSGSIPRVADVRFTTGDICFSVHTSLDGFPYIQFPSFWSNIFTDPTVFTVTYLATNGSTGRTGAETITRSTVAALNNYTISNPEASVGGYDPETVAEIKTKASIFARTMYSIVTLKDFEDMSVFVNDIMQVKALDYNNDESEFPPSIKAYVQPSPPNGVPNDAYKVLIMAVPSDLSAQSIFVGSEDTSYDNLTVAAKQLHELYMDRKAATLYIEYRDPIYINPWLVLNIYMDENNLRMSSVAQDVVDYLKILYSRGKVGIGESIYGSVIGKELLNAFSYIDYIEVRDPEYNIEAKPYEYIDLNNGFHQIFVNDKLKYVPNGLELFHLRRGDKIRLKETFSDDSSVIKNIEWCEESIYDKDNTYIPNSYKYIFDKKKGDYPHLDLTKAGVLYEDDGKVMVLSVPHDMLQFDEKQKFVLTTANTYLHTYNAAGTISDVIEYSDTEDSYYIPSYVRVTFDGSKMILEFTSAYTGVKVNKYTVEINNKIKITKTNGDIYEYVNNGLVDPEGYDISIHVENNGGTKYFYVPEDWEVVVNESI